MELWCIRILFKQCLATLIRIWSQHGRWRILKQFVLYCGLARAFQSWLAQLKSMDKYEVDCVYCRMIYFRKKLYKIAWWAWVCGLNFLFWEIIGAAGSFLHDSFCLHKPLKSNSLQSILLEIRHWLLPSYHAWMQLAAFSRSHNILISDSCEDLHKLALSRQKTTWSMMKNFVSARR